MACGDCVTVDEQSPDVSSTPVMSSTPDVSSRNHITFTWKREGVNGTPRIILMNVNARPGTPTAAVDYHNTANRYPIPELLRQGGLPASTKCFVCSLLHGTDSPAYLSLEKYAVSNPDVFVVVIIVPIEKRLKKPQEKAIEAGVKNHVCDLLGINTVTHAFDDKPHEWVGDASALKGLKPLKGMDPLPGLRKPPTKPVYCVPL